MTTTRTGPTYRAHVAPGGTLRTSLLVVLLVVVALLGAGCSQISAQMNGETVTSVPTEAPAQPILVTRDWGVVDGMVSVVVMNTTDRTLHSADAVITARDENDVLVATSLEGPEGRCCPVVDLPPGQQFGFYLDVGDPASDISHVDVAYRNVAWATADAATENPLKAHPVRLESAASETVVVADVLSSASVVPQASVQAFLTRPGGELVAVVAGRWFCFSEGRHEIRMQLLHAVPPGTEVNRVTIRPATSDPDGTPLHCAGPAENG
ncbi:MULTISPECIES: hypothetical protein [unclassified Nocardioides]|uniref:hypothetical protein n=1 Tax=unclassified Nocardioides TaxID=2615069 RepID=UPI0009F0050F|nr:MULTISPECIES: hypothetical protein [unclassified Nocardioides]GAW49973.1 hypothetical protein PD653B2_2302 [Nocardioides sp. PD653-B2]GAW55934.1 hypothetical protein PD653_3362 [Nocardioides sp. PD653]